jgi:hypothetical protein
MVELDQVKYKITFNSITDTLKENMAWRLKKWNQTIK